MTITTILGTSETDLLTLLGTELDDLITAEHNDIYIGSLQGNDTITASSAVERLTVVTGENKDNIIFTAEVLSSILTLGDGNDKANIADFSGTVYGGAGDDSIVAETSRTVTNALIRGEGGDDDFDFVNIANTIINVNSDDDNIYVAGAVNNSQIYGGRQQDSISILGKITNSLIRGDANEDIITISGELSDTIINGNADNDQIIISSDTISSSTVYGGQGNDNIDISSDAIYINGGKGNDDIDLLSSKNHTIDGGTGDDAIDSNSTKALLIDGGADKDTITITGVAANSAVHSLDGGAGNDSIKGTSGKELIDGGTEDDGNDTIDAAGGDDTVYGRAGDDLIQLTADGEFSIHGGSGDDVIEVSLDKLTHLDLIKGENGTDTLAIVGTAADFNMWAPNTVEEKAFDSISTLEALAFGTSNTSYTVSGTKEISLARTVQSAGILTIDASYASGSGDDVLAVSAFQFSSSADLTFIGSDDKDVNVKFTGGSGDDTLTTGKITEDAGDTLIGGLGVDTFYIVATDEVASVTDLGTGGNDALVVTEKGKGVVATVTADYSATQFTKNDKSSTAVVLNAEDRVDIDMDNAAGTFGYVINGGSAASTLQGSSFNDSITGGVAADSLIGNGGNDTITGGVGADTMNAGSGSGRIMDAGNGADIITHDAGSSLVVINTGTDAVTLYATRAGAYITVTGAGERTVDASTSTAALILDGSGAVANKVTYTGGSGGDSIVGGSSGDALTANDGNDTITGGLAADTINVGAGSNNVIFTSGLTTDVITGYTSDDIGAFDLSALETADAVEASETLDFVNGANLSVLADDTINMQTVSGAVTLLATTNVLNYTEAAVADAAALETALEASSGIITTNGALAENDAFVVQYIDSDTNTYSYAIAHVEDAGVNAATKIAAWEVTDIATTNQTDAFGSSQFTFVA